MYMNLPTFIILVILAVIIGAVVRGMIRDKKAGKGRSGCSGCSGCSSGGCGQHTRMFTESINRMRESR